MALYFPKLKYCVNPKLIEVRANMSELDLSVDSHSHSFSHHQHSNAEPASSEPSRRLAEEVASTFRKEKEMQTKRNEIYHFDGLRKEG